MRFRLFFLLAALATSAVAQDPSAELGLERPNPFEPRFAQSEGYLVLMSGDTLRGQINRSNKLLQIQERVGFRDSTDMPFRYYRANQLRAYGFDQFHFQRIKQPAAKSSKLEDNDVLAWRRQGGAMSHFVYLYEDEESYSAFQISARDILMNPRGELFNPGPVLGLRYWKKLRDFVEDCPAVVKAIDNDEFNKEDLAIMALRYNESCSQGP